MNRIGRFLWPVALLVLAGFTAARGAPVTEAEAVAVADVRYAMELNSVHLQMDAAEKADRLVRISSHRTYYFVGKDSLTATAPRDGIVMAYIVAYEPAGFIVVAGDDRASPILAASTESRFSLNMTHPDWLRIYLTGGYEPQWSMLAGSAHQGWSWMRSRLGEPLDRVTFGNETDDAYVLWPTAAWGQWGPYNDTVAAHCGGNPDVPTGCVATAMAIMLRHFQYPPSGNGEAEYDDEVNGMNYHHHVNYGTASYNWSAMPLNSNPRPSNEVARLMYHCGVAVEMDYDTAGSGAYVSDVPDEVNDHFRYRGTDHATTYKITRTYRTIFARSLAIWGGAGHAVIVSGYREPADSSFYVNAGYEGDRNGWYNTSFMPSGPAPGGGPVERVAWGATPNNWRMVDSMIGSTSGSGTIGSPYLRLSSGEANTPSGGTMVVCQGGYHSTGDVPITFRTPKTIRTYARPGIVRMGTRLRQYSDAAIRINSGGALKIN